MTPVEFCYWLQGAIEIGGLETINPSQAKLIRAKVLNVNPQGQFTLQTFLLLNAFPPEKVFPEIRAALNNIFVHDIDPSYEGDQNRFSDIHAGKTS